MTVLKTDKETRRLLVIGFGGLLLLLAVFGITTLFVIPKIEAQNEQIVNDYFHRDRILEQLRSDIYLSGTYVRDLLIEPDPAQANFHRRELQAARDGIGRNVAKYQSMLRNEETGPFRQFRFGLATYFASLQAALEWDAGQRRAYGYEFMKNSLLPQRLTIVHLTDQISLVNERQMQLGNQEIANLFSRFRGILTLFVVLMLSCGALLTVGSMRRILRLEQISAARWNEAEQAHKALRALSVRLIEVQESERRSLSRELHDEVGQSVSALLLGLGNVAALVAPGNAEARTQLRELRILAEKTVAVIRDMSLLLRPSMLDDLGLIPALEWQAREVSRNHNLFVQVIADPVPEDLGEEHKTCIYRIVQEALRNAVRHAHARSVRVELRHSVDNVVLSVSDDGQGFFPERGKGVGLLGMEERVMHLRGRFHIDSGLGEGTRIRVELPLVSKVEVPV